MAFVLEGFRFLSAQGLDRKSFHFCLPANTVLRILLSAILTQLKCEYLGLGIQTDAAVFLFELLRKSLTGFNSFNTFGHISFVANNDKNWQID